MAVRELTRFDLTGKKHFKKIVNRSSIPFVYIDKIRRKEKKMKKNILKIAIVTMAMIFAFTGASWADGRKNGRNYQGSHKYTQNYHSPAGGYHHYKRGGNKRHYPVVQNHHHRTKVIQNHHHHTRVVHKHYYPAPVYVQPAYPYFPYACGAAPCVYGPAFNGLSVSAQIFQPGFAFSIAAGNQW
jgi:hypothetical protein